MFTQGQICKCIICWSVILYRLIGQINIYTLTNLWFVVSMHAESWVSKIIWYISWCRRKPSKVLKSSSSEVETLSHVGIRYCLRSASDLADCMVAPIFATHRFKSVTFAEKWVSPKKEMHSKNSQISRCYTHRFALHGHRNSPTPILVPFRVTKFWHFAIVLLLEKGPKSDFTLSYSTQMLII